MYESQIAKSLKPNFICFNLESYKMNIVTLAFL